MAAEPDGSPRVPLVPIVARLTGLNALLLLLAFVTGPVQARVLGPEGRGEIAVILTVLTLAPIVLDVGLSDFVARERARGRDLGTVLGTTLPLAVGFALVGVILAVPVSDLLGQGRPLVERYVRITMFAMPLWVAGWMLIGAARGEQRWSILYRQRALTVIASAIAIVGLTLLGRLTVESLAIAMLVITLPGIAVALPVLRGVETWRFDRKLVRPALAFGSRSWVTVISSQGNYRLDQLVMAAVVPSRELGLYAVAVGFTSVVSSFVSSVSLALMPRVAQEGGQSVPRIVRVSTLVLVCGLAATALLAPLVVPLLFGSEFKDAVPLVMVLVLGSFCIGISLILGSALQGYGRPQDAMWPQLIGLLITIVGLAIALDPLGALGAAVVSVVSYATVLTGTIRAAVREFEVSPRALLLPRVEDLQWLILIAPWRRSSRS
ncbi:MAG: oligosaccharide flippase family protein [Solirubrobacteraceae bacterium]